MSELSDNIGVWFDIHHIAIAGRGIVLVFFGCDNANAYVRPGPNITTLTYTFQSYLRYSFYGLDYTLFMNAVA